MIIENSEDFSRIHRWRTTILKCFSFSSPSEPSGVERIIIIYHGKTLAFHVKRQHAKVVSAFRQQSATCGNYKLHTETLLKIGVSRYIWYIPRLNYRMFRNAGKKFSVASLDFFSFASLETDFKSHFIKIPPPWGCTPQAPAITGLHWRTQTLQQLWRLVSSFFCICLTANSIKLWAFASSKCVGFFAKSTFENPFQKRFQPAAWMEVQE